MIGKSSWAHLTSMIRFIKESWKIPFWSHLFWIAWNVLHNPINWLNVLTPKIKHHSTMDMTLKNQSYKLSKADKWTVIGLWNCEQFHKSVKRWRRIACLWMEVWRNRRGYFDKLVLFFFQGFHALFLKLLVYLYLKHS